MEPDIEVADSEGCVYFSDRTKRTGPRTEGIKFGLPDRAIIFFGRGFDLENFYLNKLPSDNSNKLPSDNSK